MKQNLKTMAVSRNTEKEINRIISSRYGRKWIVERILKILITQIAFATISFLLYMMIEHTKFNDSSIFISIFSFLGFSSTSIIKSIMYSEEKYIGEKIKWLSILKAELIQKRNQGNYGKLSPRSFSRRISMCRKMILSLRSRLSAIRHAQ